MEVLGIPMGLLLLRRMLLMGQVVIDARCRSVPHLVLLGVALLIGSLSGRVAIVLVHVALVGSCPLVGAVADLVLDVGPAVDAVVLSEVLPVGVLIAPRTSMVVVICPLDTVVDSGGSVLHHAVRVGGGGSNEATGGRGIVLVVLVLICCGLVVAHNDDLYSLSFFTEIANVGSRLLLILIQISARSNRT